MRDDAIVGSEFSVEPPRIAVVGVLIGHGRCHTVQRILGEGYDFIAVVNAPADQATNQHPRWGRNGRRTTMRNEMDVAVKAVQPMDGAAKRGEETAVKVAAPVRW